MELKQPLSICDQVTRLKEHGLCIKDNSEAEDVLSRVGYYRYTGYALQFRKEKSDSDYVENIQFERIYRIYCFDKRLREIIRSHIETVEVYYKTQIAHIFSMRKCTQSPHDQHYNQENYYNKEGFREVLSSLSREQEHFKDSLIVKHHKEKYQERMPLWVCVELLSFSNVSKLYSAMYFSDKEAIANSLGTGRETLENHLHCLSVLRNKCAHTARLYNTRLSPPSKFSSNFLRKHPEVENDTLFAYLLVLHKRLPTNQDRQLLRKEISELLDLYSGDISLELMGFPKNWEQLMANTCDTFKMITGQIQ